MVDGRRWTVEGGRWKVDECSPKILTMSTNAHNDDKRLLVQLGRQEGFGG